MVEEVNVGLRVQEFRKKSHMSLRELAAQAELSPSMLSQIESNSVNPSINTLKNIAAVLHVPLFQFFKQDASPKEVIVRNGQNLIIGHPGAEVLYKLLTPDINGTIEFCLMEVPVGKATSDVAAEHEGEEVAYVISGEVDLELNSDVYYLQAGDSVRIPAFSPHRWINPYKQEAKVVFAVTPPSF